MSEDYYKPSNFQKQLLNQLQLPQESSFPLKKNQGKTTSQQSNHTKNNKYNVYQQQEQQQLDQLRLTGLKEISSIQKKPQKYQIKKQIQPIKNQDDDSFSGINDIGLESNRKKNYQKNPTINNKVVRRVNKKGKKIKKQIQSKQQINIDLQTNQVMQWAQKKTKNIHSNSNSQDQQQTQNIGLKNVETQETIEIKKRLQQKIKNMSENGNKNKTGGSLKAKAEELRLKNQKQAEENQIKNKKEMGHHNKMSQIKQMEQEEEDPWDKINQATLQKQKQEIINKKSLTWELVLKYYRELELEKQQKMVELEDQDDLQDGGCFGALCGCIKQGKVKRSIIETQLLCLAKLELSDIQQDLFVLKEIWTKLTHKPFERFGQHWNQIGFQGRDPATDLRSTGIFSLIQWTTFIHQHPKYSQKIYNFTVEMQFPLALAHIKLTSLFLKLLRNRKIGGEKWEEFEIWYNCISYAFFKKIIVLQPKNINNVGEVIDQTIVGIEKQISTIKKQYIAWKKTSQQI